MAVDYAVIVLYLAGMLAMGWWGMRRATSKSDFLVAGRRLGPVMYSGTMAAIVLGGASTIGGVGLGYQYGLSGAWMVFTIGLGLLGLSVFFSARIARLKVYTVSEMLDLRYGGAAGLISGVVMWAYTLMLAVTSTLAYATIFDVLFGLDRTLAIVLGGAIVVAYSTLGGMWSITLTDMVQFVVKTIGVLLLLLPLALVKAGGFAQLKAQLPSDYFAPLGIGGQTVFTYVLIYSFGMLIGQDIWQRVFTARSDRVARLGGTAAGTYCLVYASEQCGPAVRVAGQGAEHGGGRFRAGGRRGQGALGRADPGQFAVPGLGHGLPDGALHGRERGFLRDLDERQPVSFAGVHQGRWNRPVHRGDAEAEGGGAGRDGAGGVAVQVGVERGAVLRGRRLRQVDAGGQQQLAAQEVRHRVGHLRGVHPVDRHARTGPGELAQAQVRPGEQVRQGDRRGGRRGQGTRHVRNLHFQGAGVEETYTSASFVRLLGSTPETGHPHRPARLFSHFHPEAPHPASPLLPSLLPSPLGAVGRDGPWLSTTR
ncbi:sodium:solute symporter [Streptomyces noursei ZPM]|nr:sodium:solute symporter [Streptomyces noursei ZPM]